MCLSTRYSRTVSKFKDKNNGFCFRYTTIPILGPKGMSVYMNRFPMNMMFTHISE